MFDWIPLVGEWSQLQQILLLAVAPLALLIPAYVFYYRANHVWEPKNRRYAGQYHWSAFLSDIAVWLAWSFAAASGLLVGISLMLAAVSAISFGAAALFILLALVAGFLVSVGALGVSVNRLHGVSFNAGEKRIMPAAALVTLAFAGIVVAGATLTSLVLIPIGGLAVLGSVSFPAQGGGELSFGIMSLLITSALFVWVLSATLWE